MKVLISACLLGHKVRWNKQDKRNQNLVEWAEENDIDLIPVCPEDELLGAPRSPIRMIMKNGETMAIHRKENVAAALKEKCEEIIGRHPEAEGFIGIHGSPTCGISVGVKNLGRTDKGYMHKLVNFPTTESNMIKKEETRLVFLERMAKDKEKPYVCRVEN